MIVSTNIGGLSNRIKSLASCIRYGKKHNMEYKVYWGVLSTYKNNNHILNCPFSKLFSNQIEIHNIGNNKIYKSHCLMIEEEDDIPIDFCNFDSKCKKKFTKSDKLNRNIDFGYNRIPENVKHSYIDAFKILRPILELQKEIDRFSKKFNDKTVSVHIRSWNRKNEGSRKDYLFSNILKNMKTKCLNIKINFFYQQIHKKLKIILHKNRI